MPSVQELLQVLEADKSPFISLLEGVAGGYANAQQNRIENAKRLMELEQMRQQKEQQRQMQEEIKRRMEAQNKADLRATGSPSAVLPQQKLSEEISQDEKGNYSRKIKTVEEPPKSYIPREYQDATGKNRVGSYEPTSGTLRQSPNDPLAPKPASDLNLGEKQNQYNQKRLTALGDALDPSKQRQGAFGVSKQVFDRAERLQSLASAFPDGNLDSRQIEEIAIGLNAMLSGSNTGAQEQVKSLVPQSVIGNAQKLAEWLSNDPRGTSQQAFVKRMMGSVEREKQTAIDQIKRTQMQRAQRYADLEKSSPDEFYNTLQSVGVDPEEYKAWKKGGFKQISAVQKPETGQNSFEPDVLAYAEKHGISPEQAAEIKRQRTGGK